MKRLIGILVIIGLLPAALSCTQAARGPERPSAPRPEESLDALARSVERRDWKGFQRYVDVDSVAESLVDAKIDKEIDRRFGDSGESVLARAFAASVRPRLVREVKDGFGEAFEESSKSKLKTAVEVFRSDAQRGIRVRDEKAIVTLESKREKKSRLLKLEMRVSGDHWKVVRILNAADLV
ncbi:MAG: hypothetical protein C4521_01600 [Actinobacteria bacterium]|nr:MAG: hypothetical protein C4521_01600 [Actinomycetota bacterium]